MNRIIHFAGHQFEPGTRKIKRSRLRKIIGKPKHRGDITDRSATFLEHPEDKQHSWCFN